MDYCKQGKDGTTPAQMNADGLKFRAIASGVGQTVRASAMTGAARIARSEAPPVMVTDVAGAVSKAKAAIRSGGALSTLSTSTDALEPKGRKPNL